MDSTMRNGDPQATEYQLVDKEAAMSGLETQFRNHAIIVWFVLPAFAVCQVFVPFLAPTCRGGFHNICFLFLFAVECHHIYAEHQAWKYVKSMLYAPELTVLRQLGVLKKRRRFVILGIIEEMDLFTDVTFPFVAEACSSLVTTDWMQAWSAVPVMGEVFASVLNVVRFWGVAAILAGVNVAITGWLGVGQMFAAAAQRKVTRPSFDGPDENIFRIHGATYFQWARSAEVAMMPSVAALCEEMALQQQFKWDHTKDVKIATEARTKAAFGKMTQDHVDSLEAQDVNEMEKVLHAFRSHYIMLLVVKVFIGNVLMVWIQASFFALTFVETNPENKYKVIFSMAASALQAAIRCKGVTKSLGVAGFVLSMGIFFIIGWSLMKVKMAFDCPEHLWNLSSGCVNVRGTHR